MLPFMNRRYGGQQMATLHLHVREIFCRSSDAVDDSTKSLSSI